MGTAERPAESDCRALNERIRRVGVGATLRLGYPPAWADIEPLRSVVDRDETPSWFSRDLREHERSIVCQPGVGERHILIGYEPWHARSVPVLYREACEGVPVWELSVVERGLQLDAARAAADIYPEVRRYGGR